MEARRAASRRGPFIGSTSDRRSKFDQLALRPNQRKFTHYQGYHRRRLAFLFGLPSARPHAARKDIGMFYIHADPPKYLPPIPMRVSRRSIPLDVPPTSAWTCGFDHLSRVNASNRNASILIEHALNVVLVRCLGQGQREQDRSLLRAQVISDHHARFVPVVIAHDTPFANPRALHHHSTAFF